MPLGVTKTIKRVSYPLFIVAGHNSKLALVEERRKTSARSVRLCGAQIFKIAMCTVLIDVQERWDLIQVAQLLKG